MEKEQNLLKNVVAAQAELKRKKIMHDKPKNRQSHLHHSKHLRSETTISKCIVLDDITCEILNQENQSTHDFNDIHIQPDTSYNFFLRKNTRIGVSGIGVNLLSRFNEVSELADGNSPT